MKRSNFQSFFRRHLPYWVVIGGLAGWIFYLKRDDGKEAFFQVLGENLDLSADIHRGEMEKTFGELSESLTSYSSPQNANLYRRAAAIDEAKWKFLRFSAIPDGAYSMPDSSLLKFAARLDAEIFSLRDTLCEKIGNDTLFKKQLTSLLKRRQEEKEFFENSSESGRILWWQYWRYKGFLACYATMRQLSESSFYIICNFGREPVISLRTVTPMAGELFKADFFLSDYQVPAVDLKAKINGRPVALKHGLVSYANRFNTPGKKNIEVEFEWTDWLQAEKTSVRKTFEVTIQKPCPK